MEKKDAIAIIKSRKFISQTGAYELRVTSVTPHEGKFIVNLGGMTQYHIDEAKRLLIAGEIQEAVNQSLSASLRPTDYIPSKGEIVKTVVDEITTKNDVTGLFVMSLTELKANKATRVSGFDEFEDAAEADPIELVATKTTTAKK